MKSQKQKINSQLRKEAKDLLTIAVEESRMPLDILTKYCLVYIVALMVSFGGVTKPELSDALVKFFKGDGEILKSLVDRVILGDLAKSRTLH